MYLRPPFCPGERAPDAPMVRMPLFPQKKCGCPVCGAMLCDECAEREQGLCADCAAAGRDE